VTDEQPIDRAQGAPEVQTAWQQVAWQPAYRPVRQRFRHRWSIHLLLFALTFVTTSFAQAFIVFWGALGTGISPFLGFTGEVFLDGLWYSLPLLAILSAHEFGHYFACRLHRVDATLPYFIPAPLPLTGTLGAVIRIREAFPSKRALFDIGVAGPVAGFAVLVPFLIWGMSMSTMGPVPQGQESIYFGEPLLWKIVERLYFGPVPEGYDTFLHPTGFAAWWGMLATALNLLPFGQLDGGHIAYAALGRRAAWISAATLALVVLLNFGSSSWTFFALMLVAMAIFIGFRHPRIHDEDVPLDPVRRLVAVIATIIFILCFTPVPISIVG
jgi:membrane-associated protease RseP (regulator of RpoE activity)